MTRTAIVTGSRKGIGNSIANHLLNLGWNVAGCSRGESSIEHTNYRHYAIDVADEQAVVKMVRDVTRQFVQIDALVNNAGIASMNHCLLTPARTVEEIFATNVFGTFYFLRECGKRMRKSGEGRIVNFSTVAVALDLEGEAIYAASKSAVESLTRVASRELASFGITVNAIGPTPVDTDLTRTVPKDKLSELIQRQPIPRIGKIDDVLNVVDFFLKPESNFITGQIIYLGGIRG